MHIPDGFIDAKTAVTAAGFAAVGVGLALRQVKRELPPRRVPFLGLAAAFLFAAQMVNFPVAAGTSGHLMGGALVTGLLGPAAAIVVMTSVLIVQCFLFADGGVMALGANVFNLAVLGPVVAHFAIQGVRNLVSGDRGRVAAVAFGAWCSVVSAAIACAGQLAWSGTVSWRAAFPAMVGTHIVIGIAEGLISGMVYLFVARTRPQIIADSTDAESRRPVLLFGGLITIGIILFVAPFASPWPDGLEAVAARLGFEHAAANPAPALMPDYNVSFMDWSVGSTAAAGMCGALIVFGLSVLFGRMLVPSKINPPSRE